MQHSRRSITIRWVAIFSLILAIINIRVGTIIFGFDNSSPFFSAASTIHRIFFSENFFSYGGNIFSPALLLSMIRLPAWLISHLTYLGMFVVGNIYLAKILLRDSYNKATAQRPPFRIAFTICLIICGNLLTQWFFSIPSLVFTSSYAGVAAFLYYLLENKEPGKETNISRLINIVLLLIGISAFYTTSINVGAFFIYAILTLIMAALLKDTATSFKVIAAKWAKVILVWLLLVQALLLLGPQKNFIMVEMYNYGKILLTDAKSAEVTGSLFRMEAQRNSLLNTLRMATGWISLTDAADSYLYRYKAFVDSFIGIIFSLFPVLMGILVAIRDKDKNSLKLVYVLLFAVGISSMYLHPFLAHIPAWGSLFRWVSSKLWPIIFIPTVVLIYRSITVEKSSKILTLTVLTALAILCIPWLRGIVDAQFQVALPPEYQEALSPLQEKDKLLYVPEPQRLYMRQYKWGYYGSSFLPYLTKATIIDNGSFSPEHNDYQGYVNLFNACDLPALTREGFTHVLVDDSTLTGKVSIPTCYTSTNKTEVLTLVSLIQ